MTARPLRFSRFQALTVFSGAVAAFMLVAAAVVMVPAVELTDARVNIWVHAHALPVAIELMLVISFLGAPSTLTAVTAAIASVLMYRHQYRQSIVLLAVVVGGNLLNVGLKHLLHRGRPAIEDPLLMLPTYSFPSGHAMAATVFYGLAAAYAVTHLRSRHLARSAILAAVIMITLVCVSRVYLGVHYLSDVIAGLAEGIAWLVVSLTALEYVSDRGKISADGRENSNS